MGISEYGFLIRNQEWLDEVLRVIKSHNDAGIAAFRRREVGEEIWYNSILRHNETGNLYFCCGNGGGRDDTCKYIMSHYMYDAPGRVVWPFAKPSWWWDEDKYTYVWKAKNATDIPTNIF
uniref:Uncharacterized protein n=1 Tax=Pithovirus LCPAC304 TaxID=2506594 RepID=A0A481Z9E1_9VIRU|nr:MAG: hypothetical protein LCPAC304_03450 [Pithovirus LCPAC304]